MSSNVRYSADLTAGSLKIRESRIIADLLLKGVSDDEFRNLIVVKNILQMRSPSSAVRLAKLIRSRLIKMNSDHWVMVRDGDQSLASQALLVAAVKHSALLRDFLNLALRTEYRLLHTQLLPAVWSQFLVECESRSHLVSQWSESTRKRLRSSVFQILSQAGYVGARPGNELKKFVVLPEISDYLSRSGENTLLQSLQMP